jgi:spore coat protein CotF
MGLFYNKKQKSNFFAHFKTYPASIYSTELSVYDRTLLPTLMMRAKRHIRAISAPANLFKNMPGGCTGI